MQKCCRGMMRYLAIKLASGCYKSLKRKQIESMRLKRKQSCYGVNWRLCSVHCSRWREILIRSLKSLTRCSHLRYSMLLRKQLNKREHLSLMDS